jgi:hypothetical protein
LQRRRAFSADDANGDRVVENFRIVKELMRRPSHRNALCCDTGLVFFHKRFLSF